MFFIADPHFCHGKMIEYFNEPFKNSEERDEYLIAAWNRAVPKKGRIYIGGDFSKAPFKKTEQILKRLNGIKYLCVGCHDRETVKKLSGYFAGIERDFTLQYKKQIIFISHYFHLSWPKSHYGSWHLFGHSHGRLDWLVNHFGKCADVCGQNNNYSPWPVEEIAETMKRRPFNWNDLSRACGGKGRLLEVMEDLVNCGGIFPPFE
jgi:calcineurin-like phosphoesterase family protein